MSNNYFALIHECPARAGGAPIFNPSNSPSASTTSSRSRILHSMPRPILHQLLARSRHTSTRAPAAQLGAATSPSSTATAQMPPRSHRLLTALRSLEDQRAPAELVDLIVYSARPLGKNQDRPPALQAPESPGSPQSPLIVLDRHRVQEISHTQTAGRQALRRAKLRCLFPTKRPRWARSPESTTPLDFVAPSAAPSLRVVLGPNARATEEKPSGAIRAIGGMTM